MSIDALGPIGVAPIAPITPVSGSSATDGLGGALDAGGADFGSVLAAKLGNGLEQLQGLHERTNQLAVQAATGSLTDVHDYMIASAQSGLATELTVAVRNKAVEAFNEIMRMQA